MRDEEEFDHLVKVVIIGDAGVGKSNLLHRYVCGKFDLEIRSTIGVEFRTKTIEAQIWDTAGQDCFRTIIPAFYRKSHGALLVYDITNRRSFNNLSRWIVEMRNYTDENITFMLVGNRHDMRAERQVSMTEAKKFADENRMFFLETSALTGTGVNEAFTTVLLDIYSRLICVDSSREPRPSRAASVVSVNDRPMIKPRKRFRCNIL